MFARKHQPPWRVMFEAAGSTKNQGYSSRPKWWGVTLVRKIKVRSKCEFVQLCRLMKNIAERRPHLKIISRFES